MKDWFAREWGKLRGRWRPNPDPIHTSIHIPGPPKPKRRPYILTLPAIIRQWINTHRVWFWAFLVFAGYLLLSGALLELLDAHYQRHPDIKNNLRIDHLAFWDKTPEDARNLILVIGGWLGVLAAIIGFVLAGFRTSTQLQMTQTAIDGQVTERFTRAVEQLGHEKRAVRLGAIYALERIARDSARDRDTIVETLAAYIRESAPWPPRDKDGYPLSEEALKAEMAREAVRPPIDIDAALNVICRLLPHGDPMRQKTDLRHTDLRGLDAPRIDLSRMRLDNINLSGAKLFSADMTWASLNGANLARSDLFAVKLHRGSLNSADLSKAILSGADLSKSNLAKADLRGVDLYDANLSGALLWKVNLKGGNLINVNLRKAQLFGAELSGSDLSGTDLHFENTLTQQQIDGIRYARNHPPFNLPAGLTLPEPYDDEDW